MRGLISATEALLATAVIILSIALALNYFLSRNPPTNPPESLNVDTNLCGYFLLVKNIGDGSVVIRSLQIFYEGGFMDATTVSIHLKPEDTYSITLTSARYPPKYVIIVEEKGGSVVVKNSC